MDSEHYNKKKHYEKILELVDVLKKSSDFTMFLIKSGRMFYRKNNVRGGVTIDISYYDYDNVLNMVNKCYDVFTDARNYRLTDIIKIDLMNTALKPCYYIFNKQHLTDDKLWYRYQTYDVLKSCMLIIMLSDKDSSKVYSYYDYIGE